MKTIFTILVTSFLASAVSAQNKISIPDSTKKIKIVEASCGQCQFGMKDKKGCDLAVRIDGKAYFVKGTSIDEHGDAHSNEGFCETIRKAEVQGKVDDNQFKVTYFKLLPVESKPATKDKPKQ